MYRTLFILTLAWATTAPVLAQDTLGIYIANQGNFSAHDGSITWYDLSTGQAEEVLANFGTLVQSITLSDDFGYIASNTSNAIDILKLSSNERVGQIPGIASPRYITVVDQNKAYVSELSSSRVMVLDLASQAIVDSITTGTNPEDIAVVGDRAFVANSGFGADSTLTVIDILNDAVVDTLDLECDGPRHLEVDAQDELWSFCNGKTVYNLDFTEIVEQTNGAAIVLNPATGDVIKRIEFDYQAGTNTLGQDTHYSPNSEEIFLIRSDSNFVVIFDTATNDYKETITIPGSESIGGLVYDANSSLLYVGRIANFVTPGFVQILNRTDLSEAGRFDTGVAPAHLVFHTDQSTTATATAVLPGGVSLAPAYPNPFTRSTTLSFTLEKAGPISLVIYDALGREVSRLVSGSLNAGRHHVVWNAEGLSTGTYFSRLMGPSRIVTGKLVMVN